MDNSAIMGAVAGVVIVVSGWLACKMMCGSSKVGASNGKKRSDSVSLTNEQKYPAGKLSIYFGSQTGTAEGFARVLMEEGRSKGFDAKMCDLDSFDADELAKSKLAIFLMATYGEGEPTDNAARFAKWIDPQQGEAAQGCLSDTSFTVFGLGNKQYEHFNRMGKTTNRELERLGAVRVHEYGEGDDDNALEDDFEAWKGSMWDSLVAQFHPQKSDNRGHSNSVAESKVTLAFECIEINDEQARQLVANPPRTAQLASSTRHFFTSKSALVRVNRELRASDSAMRAANLSSETIAAIGGGSTRHLEIELAGTGLTYSTADNLAVLPENDAQTVSALCSALGYGGQNMTVKPCGDGESEFKYAFPVPFTAKDALTRYFDIAGHPSLGVMKQLLPYVADPKQKSWLQGYLEKDQRSAWKSYLEASGASIAWLLLNELSSCKPPLSDLLNILPFIQPRYYTISSSSSAHPDAVHITVSITQYALPNGKVFRGLASGYLQRLHAGQHSCRVYVRPSTFRLPSSIATPIVMIGPGTGIAPMRALLQERKFQNASGGKSASHGNKIQSNKNTLYFGCRSSHVDFIYKEELAAFAEEGVLTKLHTAFSRERQTKVYVQHLLVEQAHGEELIADLEAGAYVFVCGATKMGVDVMEAFTTVLVKVKGLSREKAQTYVKDLQKKGRYVQELWSADG